MKITGITYQIKHGESYYNVIFATSEKTWTVSKYDERANLYSMICKPITFNGRASSNKTAAQRVLLMGIHANSRGERA